MHPRTTIILLLAVIGLGLYILFGERHHESTDERKTSARLALRIDPDSVTSLRIESGGALFMLGRTNKAWRLTSPVQALADGAVVMHIVDTIATLRKSEIITPEEIKELGIDTASYGFDAPRATIVIDDGRQRSTLLVGRDSPAGQIYVKRTDLDEIIVTDRELLAALPASVLDIRERRLFSGQPGGVRRIELQSRRGVFHGSRTEEDQWIIDRPVYARGLGSAIRPWLERLYEFRVHDFVAESVAAGSLYGFDEPVAQVALFTESKAAPQVLKIGRPADVEEQSHFATVVGEEAVFTVTGDLIAWLNADTSSFRDVRLLAMPVMNIGFIQMTDGDRVVQLARNTQDVWEVIAPKRFNAYPLRIQRILSQWSGAKTDRFIDPPFPTGTVYGTETPVKSIRFARAVPDLSAPLTVNTNAAAPGMREGDVTFVLGSTNDADRLFISPADQPYVMDVPAGLMELFSVNPLDYRDPVVLAEDAATIRRIAQTDAAGERMVERTNGQFRASSPQRSPDVAAVDQILFLASRLVAARLVEEDSTDLQPYGLDVPSRQLVLGLSGTTGLNRVLLIGQPATENEFYATVQGSDLVFTLTTQQVDALMKPVALPRTASASADAAAP